jgi:hypothetical protein
MLPAIVLSSGCKEPSEGSPQKSTRTITDLKRLICNGAILVVGKGFMPHFFKKGENLSPEEDIHQEEIRHLIKLAHKRGRLWMKEDIPLFVSNEIPRQDPFKYIATIFLQSKEFKHSEEWEKLAFRKGFEIQGYHVKIRTLSQGTEDIKTSFSTSINQGDPMDCIGHHLRPLIHWCTSITIYDGYCVENHSHSLKNKGQVSGLSNFFGWVVDERKEMKTPLNRIRVIQRKRGKNYNDVRSEMTEVFSELVKNSELNTVVNSSKGIDTGIFLGFRPDAMGERLIVFERDGASLTYSFGSKGFAMLDSSKRRMRVLKNFDIMGPLPFVCSGFDGRQLISDMNNQGKFIQYPFDKTSNFRSE